MNKLDALITSLGNALLTFKSIIKDQPTDVERDAAIQRFEYCFELTWKTMRLYLSEEGFPKEMINSPKQVIKTAFQNQLITNEEQWINMLIERNLTVHTYNENLAAEIYGDFEVFHQEMEKVLNLIKEKI